MLTTIPPTPQPGLPLDGRPGVAPQQSGRRRRRRRRRLASPVRRPARPQRPALPPAPPTAAPRASAAPDAAALGPDDRPGGRPSLCRATKRPPFPRRPPRQPRAGRPALHRPARPSPSPQAARRGSCAHAERTHPPPAPAAVQLCSARGRAAGRAAGSPVRQPLGAAVGRQGEQAGARLGRRTTAARRRGPRGRGPRGQAGHGLAACARLEVAGQGAGGQRPGGWRAARQGGRRPRRPDESGASHQKGRLASRRESTPVSTDRRGYHHYTNEDGGGRPAPDRPPAACRPPALSPLEALPATGARHVCPIRPDSQTTAPSVRCRPASPHTPPRPRARPRRRRRRPGNAESAPPSQPRSRSRPRGEPSREGQRGGEEKGGAAPAAALSRPAPGSALCSPAHHSALLHGACLARGPTGKLARGAASRSPWIPAAHTPRRAYRSPLPSARAKAPSGAQTHDDTTARLLRGRPRRPAATRARPPSKTALLPATDRTPEPDPAASRAAGAGATASGSLLRTLHAPAPELPLQGPAALFQPFPSADRFGWRRWPRRAVTSVGAGGERRAAPVAPATAPHLLRARGAPPHTRTPPHATHRGSPPALFLGWLALCPDPRGPPTGTDASIPHRLPPPHAHAQHPGRPRGARHGAPHAHRGRLGTGENGSPVRLPPPPPPPPPRRSPARRPRPPSAAPATGRHQPPPAPALAPRPTRQPSSAGTDRLGGALAAAPPSDRHSHADRPAKARPGAAPPPSGAAPAPLHRLPGEAAARTERTHPPPVPAAVQLGRVALAAASQGAPCASRWGRAALGAGGERVAPARPPTAARRRGGLGEGSRVGPARDGRRLAGGRGRAKQRPRGAEGGARRAKKGAPGASGRTRSGASHQKGRLGLPSGNRTPVSRVTGGDTHHYTNEDGGGRPAPDRLRRLADATPPSRPRATAKRPVIQQSGRGSHTTPTARPALGGGGDGGWKCESAPPRSPVRRSRREEEALSRGPARRRGGGARRAAARTSAGRPGWATGGGAEGRSPVLAPRRRRARPRPWRAHKDARQAPGAKGPAGRVGSQPGERPRAQARRDGRAVQGAALRSQSPLEAWVRIPLRTRRPWPAQPTPAYPASRTPERRPRPPSGCSPGLRP
ncbi:serine/arginine repetitive matrix protein 1-like [Equus asinus]|uniref:serine/arginine repetitive matrix protein 1-like n=1 Tax=Equus asinus TaxID=9793 RepID=UPI0038F6EC2F